MQSCNDGPHEAIPRGTNHHYIPCLFHVDAIEIVRSLLEEHPDFEAICVFLEWMRVLNLDIADAVDGWQQHPEEFDPAEFRCKEVLADIKYRYQELEEAILELTSHLPAESSERVSS